MPLRNVSRSLILSVRAAFIRALIWAESATLSRMAARYYIACSLR